MYYGINDHGLVIRELIENEKNKREITKKVQKVIKEMIWSEQIGELKRGEQTSWQIRSKRRT